MTDGLSLAKRFVDDLTDIGESITPNRFFEEFF